MHISDTIISAAMGSGLTFAVVKAFFEKEVQKSMESTINDIKTLVNSKQCREICSINHNNIDRRLESIEEKLDKLIDMRGTE